VLLRMSSSGGIENLRKFHGLHRPPAIPRVFLASRPGLKGQRRLAIFLHSRGCPPGGRSATLRAPGRAAFQTIPANPLCRDRPGTHLHPSLAPAGPVPASGASADTRASAAFARISASRSKRSGGGVHAPVGGGGRGGRGITSRRMGHPLLAAVGGAAGVL